MSKSYISGGMTDLGQCRCDSLDKAEAEVRQLTELYDDLAYVCPPEKAKAHIMQLEAELAEAKRTINILTEQIDKDLVPKWAWEQLREALEWYADEGNYLTIYSAAGVTNKWILCDNGKRARDAIGGE